ncbi:ABC transporter ATP-binding protein [Bordetella parapertussis]|uniref:ATP-binding component of ABC transporter n=1 Tax=Bordetella parapertussis (strain Bpp5) TaxID=1208660 RepID=K0MAB6_BORPB|nr:ABC transporter ATP-binding protein [Bordetella parapertussis]CCJ51078.1 ATP-binding component of ABC transporter [Bordetella parapertussis Bpp5]
MQVSFQAIHQRYGEQTLFENLDLTLPSGKFFTLLGPSGCGKTTLLRMLAGFIRPNDGRILSGDTDVTRIPVHRRDVGMVFQDYALFPDRSVLTNVCYGLAARNVPAPQARERAMAMLERVGLAAFAQRSPAQLSGGQRQRVAMARALVIEPRLLLLDEPLLALDVKLRAELRGLIRGLQVEAGITTVFVTHDQEEALAMSDFIAVMDRGRVMQVGEPREIYTRPGSSFVADFVGSANLIPIERELASAPGEPRRLATGAGVVRTRSPIAWRAGALLAVRREDLTLAEAACAEEGHFPGVVEHVEFRGSVTGYAVRTAAGLLRVEARVRPHEPSYARGQAVSVGIPLHSHIVDAS